MPEINPLDLIAECIEKCKATTDREQVAHHISETLGLLQIENPEDDAFNMLGSAIMEAAPSDNEHCAVLLEVWTDLDKQHQAP
jgi:hypothetical protein